METETLTRICSKPITPAQALSMASMDWWKEASDEDIIKVQVLWAGGRLCMDFNTLHEVLVRVVGSDYFGDDTAEVSWTLLQERCIKALGLTRG